MPGYVARRLLSAIPVLFLVTLISFGIMQIVPGDPAMIIAGLGASPQEVARIGTQLGLDQPPLVQLARWYQGLARGDLGQSLLLGRSVSRAVVERLPVTLSLSAYALLLTLGIGIPSGVLAALRPNTWLDQAVMTLALLGVSFPSFWLGLMLIVVFAVQLDWLPSGGYMPLTESLRGWLRSATLPAISLALLQVGLLARITRATMLDVLDQDYVRTARTKGLPGWVVVWKHAFRNVLIPVVTVTGIVVSLLLSGSVVIETVYSIPGIGRLLASAVLRRDYPMIQGGLLVTAVAFVLLNLLVDVLYGFLDPRVRYEHDG
ncbi:MAG: peptide ABC transporter [Candidatus Rokuibacteriota bacterium]|nr:MAG: peptide ABC transporter [Candidatus Rokubacteria bacterium]